MANKKWFAIFGTALVVVGAGLFVAGWFGKPGLSKEEEKRKDLINKLVRDSFNDDGAEPDMDAVSGESIRNFLADFASVPHMGGTPDDNNLAEKLKNIWIKLGLDHVELKGYDLLLDYPDPENPNLVQIFQGESEKIFESRYREVPLQKGDDHPNFVDSFLAYSPAGRAEGEVVYVNYGQQEDFELISNKSSIFYTNVTGRICLVRDGQIFRGNKAQNCHLAGCAAMVLFPDPADVAPEGTDPDQVYPNTFYLPPTGMQRGSLLLSDGDPQTPNYPSVEGAFRIDVEELKRTILPKIPCQPIGYEDAQTIFKHMDGNNAPEDWHGKLVGIKYTLGGKFVSNCTDCRMVVTTNNKLEKKFSSNVIGVLKGDIEPDRYVIVGNHRDAWGFGAVDPSSGTAQMTEIIRVLGEKVRNEKWRPRRTIVFASWAAEEYGLTGSREFVEDFIGKLTHRAVAYVNVDICTGGGDILSASASPTIKHKVIETTQSIPGIRDPTKSYYEFWKNWTMEMDGIEEPDVGLPGAGSDHASFIFYAGVPVIDFSFDVDLIQYPALADNGYPAYHTGYETLYYVESLLDPNVTIRETCSKINIRFIRDLADSTFLDLKPEAYVELMEVTMASFAFSETLDILNKYEVSVEPLRDSISKFRKEVEEWRARLDTLDIYNNPIVARFVNDQMMKLDRVFLLPQGLPDRPIYRHAIISPSKFDTYSAGSFPGLTDLVNGIADMTKDDLDRRVRQLRQHVSDLSVAIHQAGDYLKDVSIF